MSKEALIENLMRARDEIVQLRQANNKQTEILKEIRGSEDLMLNSSLAPLASQDIQKQTIRSSTATNKKRTSIKLHPIDLDTSATPKFT